MLAHKASKEGRIAVENIAGEGAIKQKYHHSGGGVHQSEVAWCGLD